jgi:hypothetical protein
MSCAPVKWPVFCALSLRPLGSGGTHAGVSSEVALPATLFLLLAVLVLGCWAKASWQTRRSLTTDGAVSFVTTFT